MSSAEKKTLVVCDPTYFSFFQTKWQANLQKYNRHLFFFIQPIFDGTLVHDDDDKTQKKKYDYLTLSAHLILIFSSFRLVKRNYFVISHKPIIIVAKSNQAHNTPLSPSPSSWSLLPLLLLTWLVFVLSWTIKMACYNSFSFSTCLSL